MKKYILTILVLSLNIYPYIGPGMGGGVLAAIIGFLAAIVLGLWGILYYPIKRSLSKKKKKNQKNNE